MQYTRSIYVELFFKQTKDLYGRVHFSPSMQKSYVHSSIAFAIAFGLECGQDLQLASNQ